MFVIIALFVAGLLVWSLSGAMGVGIWRAMVGLGIGCTAAFAGGVLFSFGWQGAPGLSSVGAVVAGGAAILGYCAWYRSDALRLLDVLAPSAVLSLSVARLGCHFDGCDFGIRFDGPWAVAHELYSGAWSYHLYQGYIHHHAVSSLSVHPFALYASLPVLSGGLVYLAWRCWHPGQRPVGQAAWFFLGWWSIIQIVAESFREVWFAFAAAQIIHTMIAVAVLVIAVATGWLSWRQSEGDPLHRTG